MESIILVGYMGAGKSTVAKELRLRTGMTYIDTDTEIEKIQGCSVRDIFARAGEATFREMETAYLERLMIQNYRGIISTGGGMPISEENRFLLHQLGTVLYLKACAETLYDRLKYDHSRPLLQGLITEEERLLAIREMLASREPFYMEAADEAIPTDGLNPVQIAEEILLYMSYQ